MIIAYWWLWIVKLKRKWKSVRNNHTKRVKCLFERDYAAAIILARRGIKLGKKKLCFNLQSQQSFKQNSHINDSFKAISCPIKPSGAIDNLSYVRSDKNL